MMTKREARARHKELLAAGFKKIGGYNLYVAPKISDVWRWMLPPYVGETTPFRSALWFWAAY